MVLSVKDINWEELKQKILSQQSRVNKYGDVYRKICLGKVSDLTPSSKHRDFGRPAQNLTSPSPYKHWVKSPELLVRPPDKTEQEDNDWWKDLVDEGKKHGVYIRPSSDKHRTFIMAGMKIKDRSET
jgi:hypothetical protein